MNAREFESKLRRLRIEVESVQSIIRSGELDEALPAEVVRSVDGELRAMEADVCLCLDEVQAAIAKAPA